MNVDLAAKRHRKVRIFDIPCTLRLNYRCVHATTVQQGTSSRKCTAEQMLTKHAPEGNGQQCSANMQYVTAVGTSQAGPCMSSTVSSLPCFADVRRVVSFSGEKMVVT